MQKKFFILGSFVIFFLAVFAAAQSNETNSTNSSVTGVSPCKAIEHRIQGRLEQYRESRDGHLKEFANLQLRLNETGKRLQDKGYNVSKLNEDLKILNEKIKKFNDDYTIFIQKLNETRNFTCGSSQGSFLAALNAAKSQLKIVRQDAEDIKELAKVTLRKDILELRLERIENKIEQQRDRIKERIENRVENSRKVREKENE